MYVNLFQFHNFTVLHSNVALSIFNIMIIDVCYSLYFFVTWKYIEKFIDISIESFWKSLKGVFRNEKEDTTINPLKMFEFISGSIKMTFHLVGLVFP